MLYDVGSQDDVDYLVMECVEGETLAKRLEKGALPLEQVLKYGIQIADALDKAHRGGVVHRDLKPGNIMLTPTGAKLLDFGLAKPIDATLQRRDADGSNAKLARDRAGHDRRNISIHVAGADRGKRTRWAQRYLLVWRGVVRDAHGHSEHSKARAS